MSKILIIGASEAEKLQISRWPKYCETPCSGLDQCLKQDYLIRCRAGTLIMVPINFWCNFDPFKKIEQVSSSKVVAMLLCYRDFKASLTMKILILGQ